MAKGSHEHRSLLEEIEADPGASRELAAAGLARRVLEALNSALEESETAASTLASELGVSQSAVSQVLNGDGNLRIYTLARYLRALGLEATIELVPAGSADVPVVYEARHS